MRTSLSSFKKTCSVAGGQKERGGGIEGNPPSDIEQDCFTYFLCRCYKMLKFFSARDDENESLLGSLTEGTFLILFQNKIIQIVRDDVVLSWGKL